MWNEIAARTVSLQQTVELKPAKNWREWFAVPSLGWSFAGAIAVLLIAIALGLSYFLPSNPTKHGEEQATKAEPKVIDNKAPGVNPVSKAQPSPEEQANNDVRRQPKTPKVKVSPNTEAVAQKSTADQSDVLFSDDAYAALDEKETQTHIENAQNLLRSVRNIEITEDDSDIDVTYEKALSRRLLNENIVLRREAEMTGKFPTKELLSDLEPFLIDIANLPDKPAADDLRVLKQRVQKTEIVAALQGGY
jgi:hypothetical protein